MTLTIDTIDGGLNYWWGLGDSQQEYYSDLIPSSTTTWTWELTKHSSGVWVFSEVDYGIINESLCNGTELCIDEWFFKLKGKPAKQGDELVVTVSKEEIVNADTEWQWCKSDPSWTSSNIYKDMKMNQMVWLCPLLQVLFKGIPLKLWIKFP
jgi:hypothetical protein